MMITGRKEPSRDSNPVSVDAAGLGGAPDDLALGPAPFGVAGRKNFLLFGLFISVLESLSYPGLKRDREIKVGAVNLLESNGLEKVESKLYNPKGVEFKKETRKYSSASLS